MAEICGNCGKPKGNRQTGECKCGRPRGYQETSKTKFKHALNRLLETNAKNLTRWLEKIAKDDPKQAIDIIIKLAEYVHPKIARQEITGADGKDLNITLSGILDDVSQRASLLPDHSDVIDVTPEPISFGNQDEPISTINTD